jgi:hypothetical protein
LAPSVPNKLTFTGALAILALDAVSAWLSSVGRFPYVLCLPASIAVYFWATYRAAKYVNVWGAMTLGAFLGLVDATLGWKISNWLGADPQGVYKNLTLNRWGTIVFGVMVYGLVISLAAFLVATLRNNRKTS